MFRNLLKAAVAVVVTPVALAVDIVTLPATAEKRGVGPFDRTAKCLNSAGKNVAEAIK